MSDDGRTSPPFPARPSDDSSETLLAQPTPAGVSPPSLARTKNTRVGWFGLLPTAFVVVVSLGLGSTILFWLLGHQVHSLQNGLIAAVRNGTFYVGEGSKKDPDGDPTSLMQALTFSAVAPSGLGTRRPVKNIFTKLNPTPLQYGLVLDLLGTSSFLGLYRAIGYASRKRSRRAVRPRMFIEALSIALVVVTLTHALGVGDFYLHQTSVSILVPLTAPISADQTGALGLAFNQSIWPEFAVDLENGSDWQGPGRVYYDVIYAGWRVAYNLTAPDHPYRVITLNAHNDSAILVPISASALSSSSPSSTSFTFPTFGTSSNCQILTGTCMNSNADINNVTCSQAGYPYIPTSTCHDGTCDHRLFADVNGDIGGWSPDFGQSFPNTTMPSNPVKFVTQLQFFGGHTGRLRPEISGILDGYFVFLGSCSVEYFNVTANYDPRTDSFDLVDKITTNPETVKTLWIPLLAQFATDRLVANLQGTMQSLKENDTSTPTALFNQEMSRLATGVTAGFYMPAPVNSASRVTQAVLGAYPVPAVFLVVGILYLYAAFAIFIFITSMTASSYGIAASSPQDHPKPGIAPPPPVEKQALVLGQTWLTNSLPLIGFAFPDRDAALRERRSVAKDPLDMINDVYEERLVLGIHETPDGTVFGIRRRHWVEGGKEQGTRRFDRTLYKCS